MGEFGGGVCWFSGDGSKTVKLLSDDVQGFYKTSSGILILVGLTHLLSDYGQVYKYVDIAGKPTTVLLAELDGSPNASIVEADGRVLIATKKSVLRLDANGKIDNLYRPSERLTPHSVAIDGDGSIYVGMRFFVLRLTPQTDSYSSEWLMPEDCRSFYFNGTNCICYSGADTLMYPFTDMESLI